MDSTGVFALLRSLAPLPSFQDPPPQRLGSENLPTSHIHLLGNHILLGPWVFNGYFLRRGYEMSLLDFMFLYSPNHNIICLIRSLMCCHILVGLLVILRNMIQHGICYFDCDYQSEKIEQMLDIELLSC